MKRGVRPGQRLLGAAATAAVLLVAGIGPLSSSAPAQVPGTGTERLAEPEDRYALAGGCYVVRSVHAGRFIARAGGFAATADQATGGEAFFFHATDLGRYLLFGTASDHLAGEGADLTGAPTASPAADWEIDQLSDGSFTIRLPATGQALVAAPNGTLSLVDGQPTDPAARFGFRLADGCALFPDVELNVSGPHLTGDTPYEEVIGYFDAHLHMTAYEFLGGRAHCGRPWHRYGVTQALVDCPDHTVADGAGAVLENFLSGDPVTTHDTVGWPTFNDWPAYDSLTHEQVYYRWLERTWRAGLRIMVNLLVENRVLCEIYPLKQNDCDEMASARLQAQRIRELERYIDAQSGGPGEGWFRIVDDPFEARRVVNQGRLAVVLGIELSEPFGCRVTLGIPQCDAADVDRQLDELDALGVRQLVVIHKFDNALGGVAFDGGTKGTIINVGNFYGTGRFWDMETCDPGDTGVHDNDQAPVADQLSDLSDVTELAGGIISVFGPPGVLPLYPPPHHCNTIGLSPLGAHAVKAMVDRQMIVDVDHMSVRARQAALDLLEEAGYSGVISSHTWATPDAYPRIYALGGVTAPYAGGSEGFAAAWRERRAAADSRYTFGLGFGADSNGLGAQGRPRLGATNPVTYPFVGLGGVVVDRQVSGARVYDVNVDGVAHYGLYPDWIEDLRQIAGDEIVADMARGSESYLQMWERATGIAPAGCLGVERFAGLRPGMAVEEVLGITGQPDRREGTTFTYCETSLDFDGDGRLTAVPDLTTGPAAGGGGRAALPATGAVDPLLPLIGAALLTVAVGLRRRRFG